MSIALHRSKCNATTMHNQNLHIYLFAILLYYKVLKFQNHHFYTSLRVISYIISSSPHLWIVAVFFRPHFHEMATVKSVFKQHNFTYHRCGVSIVGTHQTFFEQSRSLIASLQHMERRSKFASHSRIVLNLFFKQQEVTFRHKCPHQRFGKWIS